MKKPTLRDRFLYWFDNKMAKGSVSLIRFLLVATIALVVFFTMLIMLFGFNEDTEASSVIWDNIATIINAWMPASDEGTLGYRIVMALTAVSGLLLTSVLIGIVTSAMEEKIIGLRRGNSLVLEEDHTVVLGFRAGEYSLLRQLVLAAGDEKTCIAIGADMDREEMEQFIHDNVSVPKNVRIICRTVDIFDPKSIEILSVTACRTVIISPMEDADVIKSLLAVSAVSHCDDRHRVKVNAIVSRDEHRLPPSIAKKHNMTTLQTHNTIARIIAHSCTQTGLSDVFREVFNFEGSELYLIEGTEAEGKTFRELLSLTDRAVPIGIRHDHELHLNPPPGTIVEPGDRILVFSEEKESCRFLSECEPYEPEEYDDVPEERDTRVTIIGQNETLPTVIRELPENVSKVTFAGIESEDEIGGRTRRACSDTGISFECDTSDLFDEMSLLALVRNAEHIIILASHTADPDETDMNTIFLLLNLKDLRTRYRLFYNITAEMRSEANQALIQSDDNIDYIVASNMSSLFLAQLAESPQLIEAFNEILSNEGNELFMKRPSYLHCIGTHTVNELRQITYAQGYIFLGYMNAERERFFNPPLQEELEIRKSDRLIVLGEK